MKHLICCIAAAALLAACGRTETMPQLTDRVFERAKSQFELLYASLDETKTPRWFQDDSLCQAPVTWWCSGFFPGSLWLVYEYTGDDSVKAMAWHETRKLERLTEFKTDHDIGFQLMCSYGNAYRLTGDSSCVAILRAGAAKLAGRFNPEIGVIRSWDNPKWNWPVIIDNMMNLELLTQYGDKDIAIAHARKTQAEHFRPDFTSWHLVNYADDGSVIGKQTVQGASDDSAWSRGQAWALYGYTMMYRETRDSAFLSQAEGVARMLLRLLPADGIPAWDFSRPQEECDASAGAIMSSAFAELSQLTAGKQLSEACLAMSEKQARTLAAPEYLAEPGTEGGFLLKHSVGNKPGNSEVDVPLTYADYYYLESLLRLARIRDKAAAQTAR